MGRRSYLHLPFWPVMQWKFSSTLIGTWGYNSLISDMIHALSCPWSSICLSSIDRHNNFGGPHFSKERKAFSYCLHVPSGDGSPHFSEALTLAFFFCTKKGLACMELCLKRILSPQLRLLPNCSL